jgi:hypothetical protein
MSENKSLTYEHAPIPGRFVYVGLLLFVLGLAWVAVAFLTDPVRAEFNYLIMMAFTASLTVGSLFLVAMEYLIGSDWSVPLRRIPEFLTGLLVPLIIMIIPFLLYFLHDLYHWTHSEAVAADKILAGKTPYLNEPFFIIRTIVVVLLWALFTWLFTRNSRRQDADGKQTYTKMNIKLSAIFVFVFAATVTVLAIDWIMSLEPHWFSTIFGVYYFAGTVVASLALTTFVGVSLFKKKRLHPRMGKDSFYTLGTLMFAFNIFWAYIAFSQYLLIWYANLPEETFWFINRMQNGWGEVSLLLIIFHFLFPFIFLLPRAVKTNLTVLRVMAIWLLVAHYLDLYWLIMPTFSPESVPLGWMEFGFPLIPAGFAMFVMAWKSRKNNLVPVRDPKLERGLNFHL